MANMISELWHGNIIPQENGKNNSREMKDLLEYIVRHRETLEKTFTAEQSDVFEKYRECRDEYVNLAEAAIFEYAFKLGMNLAIESLYESN